MSKNIFPFLKAPIAPSLRGKGKDANMIFYKKSIKSLIWKKYYVRLNDWNLFSPSLAGKGRGLGLHGKRPGVWGLSEQNRPELFKECPQYCVQLRL